MDRDVDHIASLISEEPSVVYRSPLQKVRKEAAWQTHLMKRYIAEGASAEDWAMLAKSFFELSELCPKKYIIKENIGNTDIPAIIEELASEDSVSGIYQKLITLGIIAQVPVLAELDILGRRKKPQKPQGRKRVSHMSNLEYSRAKRRVAARRAAKAQAAQAQAPAQAAQPAPEDIPDLTPAPGHEPEAQAPAEKPEYASPELLRRAVHLTKVSSPTGFAQRARNVVAQRLGIPPEHVGVRRSRKGALSLVINIKDPDAQQAAAQDPAATQAPGAQYL